jgi:hypothetical protein
MNQEQARTYAVNELSKHHDRNDILIVLCRELDLHWPDAEKFLKEVESSQGQTIVGRQSPLILILGIGVLLGGLGLTSYGIWDLFEWVQMGPEEQIAYSQLMYYTAGSMITGIAMIAGGIIGLRKTISSIL